ncbi:MAG: TonB-dependent receptor [Acidobacteria bacterium]|nr:TonB-dependent receptor [Acidobacteriota bacterium]
MKRFLIPVFFSILLISMVHSAFAVELVLVGSDGKPLPGAHVTVVGLPGSWIADGQGLVNLDPTPDLPVVLIVARADGVALKPLTLVEWAEEQPQTLVVGAIGGTVEVISAVISDLELPPAAMATILGREELDERVPTSLTDVLATVPGAGRGGEGRSVVPSLRGLPKHRTLILLDDGRVVTERRAGASATFLDPDTLGEIEVIRGPGSVAYGSDAFGGIIRARSRMPSPYPDRIGVRYALEGSQGTPGWGAAADVEGPLAGGGFLLGAHVRDYSDYSSPEGEVFDTRWETWGIRAGWQRVIGRGVLRVSWRSDRARDVGKPNPDSKTQRRFYPLEDSDRLNLAFEQPLSGDWKRLSVSVAWDRYQLVLNKDDLDLGLKPTERAQSDTRANDVEMRLEVERSLGSTRLVMGTNITSRYGLKALNTAFEAGGTDGALQEVSSETAIKDAENQDYGLFTALHGSLGPVRLSGGLRLDLVRTSNSGGYFGDRSTSDEAVSGYVGGGIDLVDNLELTLQVAHGFRDPLLSDRYYRGETGRGFITGNPDLGPETADQLDLALRYRSDTWNVGGSAYLYRIKDMVERYKVGDDFFFRNRGEGEIRGLELEAARMLSDSLSLHLGAWWLEGEVRDDHSAIDDIPAPGVSLVLRDSKPKGLRWMIRGAAYTRHDDTGPSEQVVPGYAVLDGAIGWAFSEELQLQLLGRNLFDRTYLGSADEDSVLAPGRSFTLTLRGQL